MPHTDMPAYAARLPGAARFDYVPATDETDAEFVLREAPHISVQVSGGTFALVEANREGEPFSFVIHSQTRNLEQQQARAIRLALAQAQVAA